MLFFVTLHKIVQGERNKDTLIARLSLSLHRYKYYRITKMSIFFRRYLLLAITFVVFSGVHAGKKKDTPVYLFGYGVALLDSTVYMSAVMPLDSAEIDSKTHILNSIVRYSNQFQSYVEALYVPHVATAIFYHKNKAKLEKKYLKLRRRANEDKSLKLVEIPANEFKFVWVPYAPEAYLMPEAQTQGVKSKGRKKRKENNMPVSEQEQQNNIKKNKSVNSKKRGTR